MDEIKQLLNGIKEAVELNNSKIQSLETSLNDFRQETKEELQQINERLDSLDAGQERLFRINWEHINFLGEYSFTSKPTSLDSLRSLNIN